MITRRELERWLLREGATRVKRADGHKHFTLRGHHVVVLDDVRHDVPFFSAHFSNAVGSMTMTRERISAWPSPHSSVQMTG